MTKNFSDTYMYDILELDTEVANISDEINPNLEKYKLSKEQIDTIVSDFKNKINLVSKTQIINDLESGNIIPVIANHCRLPVWLLRDKEGHLKTVVNLFGRYDYNERNGTATYQVRELFGLISVGYIVRNYKISEKEILNYVPIIRPAITIYSKMIMRILDVLYAVNTDPIKGGTLSFLVGKFFYINLIGRDKLTDNDINMIYQSTKKINGPSLPTVLEASNKFDNEGFKNIDEFVKQLVVFSGNSLKDLTSSALIRRAILMYGEKSVFMLESFYFFLAYTISSVLSAGLIKDFAFESISGTDGTKLAAAFFEKTRSN